MEKPDISREIAGKARAKEKVKARDMENLMEEKDIPKAAEKGKEAAYGI